MLGNMALRALAIVVVAGLCSCVTATANATATAAAACMPADKPQLLTKGNDLNLVASDVVFHHGTRRCNVTSIRSVVAELASLDASVSQASATAKQDLAQGLGAASSALADLATKTSKDLAAEAKRIEDGHAADLAKLEKDLTTSYEAKLQKQAADFGKQLAAVKLAIQQQAKDGAKANDAQDAANKKSNAAMTAAISSTKNDFQMPVLKGWKHGARASAGARVRARARGDVQVCALFASRRLPRAPSFVAGNVCCTSVALTCTSDRSQAPRARRQSTVPCAASSPPARRPRTRRRWSCATARSGNRLPPSTASDLTSKFRARAAVSCATSTGKSHRRRRSHRACACVWAASTLHPCDAPPNLVLRHVNFPMRVLNHTLHCACQRSCTAPSVRPVCCMRSYATGSGGYNRIDMKTNIKIRSSVMYTATIEGFV